MKLIARTIAPDFVRRLISEEIAEGERLKWTVQVTGDPVPKVTWLRDSQVIPNCEEVRLIDVKFYAQLFFSKFIIFVYCQKILFIEIYSALCMISALEFIHKLQISS